MLIADGKLGKYGKVLENTPDEIKQEFALNPIKQKVSE